MVFHQLEYFCRSGPQDRNHSDRFTNIKGAGWFIYLRGDQEIYGGIQVSSGIAGPFDTHYEASVYLSKYLNKIRRGVISQ